MFIKEANMNDMLERALKEMFFMTADQLSFSGSSIAGVFTNVLQATTMNYTLDAGKDLWLTKHRFPQLQRDYLSPENCKVFFERSQDLLGGMGRKGIVAQMLCRNVLPAYGRHIWGNCMLGFTLRTGKPGLSPTLGMHSRSGYLGYLAPLDCALAYCIAREVAERADLDVRTFGFVWHLDCANWHPLKSVPWLMKNGLLPQVMGPKAMARYPDDDYPVIKMTRKAWRQLHDKWERGVGTDYDTEPWSQVIRMNKRFQRTMEGDNMPSLTLDDLRLLPQFV